MPLAVSTHRARSSGVAPPPLPPAFCRPPPSQRPCLRMWQAHVQSVGVAAAGLMHGHVRVRRCACMGAASARTSACGAA
eukprot:364076-Chlamydomonas_euryale.AAC.1